MTAFPPLAILLCLVTVRAVAQEASAIVTPQSPAGELVQREAYVMGTLLAATVQAPERSAGLAAIERGFSEVRRLEDLLSTWRPDTELSRLNAAPIGEPFHASPELLDLLLEARELSRLTGAAFDPGVGPLVDAWDLRGSGRVPSPDRLLTALEATGIAGFALDAGAGTATRGYEDSWLDSGGFGKGAALRTADAVLREARVASALLDFGGQVLAIGGEPGSDSWNVAVAHPERRQHEVARLRLRDASASTSGASERFVELNGRRYGHIVDPRDGWPVPAWGSVTVVTRDPLVADALSTALFVMRADAALRWSEDRADVGVLILERTADGVAASWNAALDEMGVELAAGVERRGARAPPGQSRAGDDARAGRMATPGFSSSPSDAATR